ncbi:MAG: SCO family protein [Haloplanus sp.]
MRRRTYLRALGAAGLGATVGCLGGGHPHTTLGEPDRRDGVTSDAFPFPAWGQQIPDVTIANPLGGGTVTLRDVDRPVFVTFFYSHCNTVCPRLISSLREVQIHSVQHDYADEVGFYPITIDPQRDTADRLRSYADEMNVALDAGNWQFLRPDGRDRAKTVVEDDFGFKFKRTHPEGMDGYMFTHMGLVLLVNADGYVERAYQSKNGHEQQYIADLKKVRSGGGGPF